MSGTADMTWREFMSDPFGGKGTLLSSYPDKRTWICEVEPGVFQTAEMVYVDPLLESNKFAFKESDGKRWGDGQVVASIPLDRYFRDIMPAKKAGDDKWIGRYLNDPDNRAFRTFRGNV